jgi:hypothetical protein
MNEDVTYDGAWLLADARPQPPAQKGRLPRVKGRLPRSGGDSPHAKGGSPRAEGESPHAEDVLPSPEGESPRLKGISPSPEGDAPHARGKLPPAQGVLPHARGRSPRAKGNVVRARTNWLAGFPPASRLVKNSPRRVSPSVICGFWGRIYPPFATGRSTPASQGRHSHGIPLRMLCTHLS